MSQFLLPFFTSAAFRAAVFADQLIFVLKNWQCGQGRSIISTKQLYAKTTPAICCHATKHTGNPNPAKPALRSVSSHHIHHRLAGLAVADIPLPPSLPRENPIRLLPALPLPSKLLNPAARINRCAMQNVDRLCSAFPSFGIVRSRRRQIEISLEPSAGETLWLPAARQSDSTKTACGESSHSQG